MTSATITPAQYDAIATAARRAGFESVQDAADAAKIPYRNAKYDMTRSDASSLIDDLRSGRLTPPPPPTPVAMGSTDQEKILLLVSLLSQKIFVDYTTAKGESQKREGVLMRLIVDEDAADASMQLTAILRSAKGRDLTCVVRRIAAVSVEQA